MWKAKLKDGKEVNENNCKWPDIKNEVKELSLVINNKTITLPNNMEQYHQSKSASASLGGNNIEIESRNIGFSLGNKVIAVKVNEKTNNISIEVN
jgi:hypothetical protein